VISRRQQKEKKKCNKSTSTTTIFLVAPPAVFAYQFDAGPWQPTTTGRPLKRRVYHTCLTKRIFPLAGSSQHARAYVLSLGNTGLLSLSRQVVQKLQKLVPNLNYHVPETVSHSEHVIFFPYGR
jgi:hypothetical protein